MKIFMVTYSGSSRKYQKFQNEIRSNSSYEAVRKVYSEIMDANYFPQDDGSIKDCDGNTIAQAHEDIIEYDGGYFKADLLYIEKDCLDCFGKRYSVQFKPFESVKTKIENIDWKSVFSELYKIHPEMQGSKTVAYLNLESLEIEYHSFLGNTSLQKTSHLLEIENMRYSIGEGLKIEDFLDEDEIENYLDANEGNTDEIWNYIKSLDDYTNRIIHAYMYYFEQRQHEHTKQLVARVEKIYQDLELI